MVDGRECHTATGDFDATGCKTTMVTVLVVVGWMKPGGHVKFV